MQKVNGDRDCQSDPGALAVLVIGDGVSRQRKPVRSHGSKRLTDFMADDPKQLTDFMADDPSWEAGQLGTPGYWTRQSTFACQLNISGLLG